MITYNGDKDVRIQDFFSKIETKYAEIIRKIENGRIEQLNENDFLDIIWFISFLYARNLSKVNRFSEISEGLLSFVGNGLLNYNLRKQGEKHLRPFIQIKVNENYVHKMAMLTMYKTAETMFNLLKNEGDWFFCISRSDSEFITTDDPMENMVMIPLSRKILFMRVTERIDRLNKRVLYVTPDWVRDINSKIASSAKRFVYASSSHILKQYFK